MALLPWVNGYQKKERGRTLWLEVLMQHLAGPTGLFMIGSAFLFIGGFIRLPPGMNG